MSERESTLESFAPTQRFSSLAIAPDGTGVAYGSTASGQFNLWLQPTDGSARSQLTDYSDNAVRAVAWSPVGDDLVFLADHHGDEFLQVYRTTVAGSEPEALTAAAQVRHAPSIGGTFSPDGRFVAYSGNDEEPVRQDVLIRDLATGDVRRIVPPAGLAFAGAFSPDGQSLLLLTAISNSDASVHLAAADGAGLQELTPHEGEVMNLPGPWRADGTGFFLLTNAGREFTGLYLRSMADGTLQEVAAPDWDVEDVAYATSADVAVWVVNEDGVSALHGRDFGTGESLVFPPIPTGSIQQLQISDDGRGLAFLIASATRPTEIGFVDREAHTFTYLTDSRPESLRALDCRDSELVHFPTHDGREIPAFLYRPAGEGPFPVVLSIHGGPEAQELPAYNYGGLYQYLLSAGIGILAPNVRGSTGYGKSYQALIHRDWGGAELGDFERAVTYLRTLDWVDGDRIGVFGGSFGGFATLSCISRLPDLWAAAVSIVGPSNLVTFAKAVPPTWRPMMKAFVGDPETEADFLMSRSPITYAEAITTPLFVIQGAQDPRVVKSESDQIVQSLRDRGVSVRYDVYEDEGHGFTKRENEIRAYTDTAAFLVEKLRRS